MLHIIKYYTAVKIEELRCISTQMSIINILSFILIKQDGGIEGHVLIFCENTRITNSC